jgi:hypothetical protein
MNVDLLKLLAMDIDFLAHWLNWVMDNFSDEELQGPLWTKVLMARTVLRDAAEQERDMDDM